MREVKEISGRCLCGAVRFTARPQKPEIGVCHCGMCRRWVGGPLFALDCGDAVSFSGEEHIKVYRSSEWAERGFCGNCGSALFWRMHGQDHWVISAGTLDDSSGLALTSQIFIDEKPDYYDLANDTEMLTGAEVFAKFSGAAEGH